jgi:hypothetical protein
MPRDAEKDQLMSLVTQSTRQLSTKASLVTRGLRDISEHLRAESVGPAQDQDVLAHPPSIDWNHPTIIGSICTGWPETDSPEHGPGAKWVILVCELTNISDKSQDLRGELAAFRRSQTGKLTALTNARLIDAAVLEAHGTSRVHLEFVWSFSENTPLENCAEEIFRGSCDLLVYDKTFKTVVVIPGDEKAYRDLGLNQRYIICEECGTEYLPGTVKVLPISEALRFDLWPDDMKMFFCAACDTYVVMSLPHINEE